MLKRFIGVKMSPYRLAPMLMSEVSLSFCLIGTLDYISLFRFRIDINILINDTE